MIKKFYIYQNHSFKFIILTDYAQQYVESQWELLRRYWMICSNKTTALIYENHKAQNQDYTVDLAARSCSCKDFENIQIPCRHAIAVIWEFKYAVNDFIHEAYYITSYKATYQASLIPVNMELLEDSDCGPCNLKS